MRIKIQEKFSHRFCDMNESLNEKFFSLFYENNQRVKKIPASLKTN